MFISPKTGVIVTVDDPYTGDDGTKYPAGWLRSLTQAQVADLGLSPYTPPEEPPAPEPVPQELSFAQLLIGLVAEGWLPAADARAWRDRTALPAQVQALIATLPPEQQFAAETRAIAPSEVLRNDPLVVGLGAVQGKTPEDLDNFFRTYAGV